jgi:hypothetical protein
MEFRDPFSRLKNKVKHRLTGGKHKPEKTGVNVDGERVDETGSRPGSEPHVVAGGGHDQEGREPNADGGQVLSTIRLPQPDESSSLPVRGGVNNQERRGADVDGGEIEQAYPHLHSVDVEVAEGSGLVEGKGIDEERVGRVDPSPSTTSISHEGKPNSA